MNKDMSIECNTNDETYVGGPCFINGHQGTCKTCPDLTNPHVACNQNQKKEIK